MQVAPALRGHSGHWPARNLQLAERHFFHSGPTSAAIPPQAAPATSPTKTASNNESLCQGGDSDEEVRRDLLNIRFCEHLRQLRETYVEQMPQDQKRVFFSYAWSP